MKEKIYYMKLGTWFWNHRAECRMMRIKTIDKVNAISEFGVTMCMSPDDEFEVIPREKVINGSGISCN